MQLPANSSTPCGRMSCLETVAAGRGRGREDGGTAAKTWLILLETMTQGLTSHYWPQWRERGGDE